MEHQGVKVHIAESIMIQRARHAGASGVHEHTHVLTLELNRELLCPIPPSRESIRQVHPDGVKGLDNGPRELILV